ncbi:uncharacterized protein A4U43_C01F14310 [Asparagus officinalis]|uniref:Uncharacterized protein n=1 Tax=Asparagus officinalis TaxID=4686 RepID=A0A5P1FTY0_ASPOF|nr:uncharacterized protein A4U43_C01F14310 [Asparagus officinalis]
MALGWPSRISTREGKPLSIMLGGARVTPAIVRRIFIVSVKDLINGNPPVGGAPIEEPLPTTSKLVISSKSTQINRGKAILYGSKRFDSDNLETTSHLIPQAKSIGAESISTGPTPQAPNQSWDLVSQRQAPGFHSPTTPASIIPTPQEKPCISTRYLAAHQISMACLALSQQAHPLATIQRRKESISTAHLYGWSPYFLLRIFG